ncbi:hypothetical protein PILCRDRAFT_814250 [Piloderma croceum F 1598]|uniref:SH3 domain-containing protein n=1 Tax=Piloderma croceum (strain F 1598) TaxID=765440 RepID=A0A0C3CF33_PILCF|nr:hypothetical protein PILCRDRAFT_814250 [Piloderma croceum F 1598]
MSDLDPSQRSRHWRDSTETLVEVHPKSFGVKVDELTWGVLPAALERYRLGRHNWRTYVLFMCYDSNGRGDSQKQRCLSYDEKPLRLWIWLRDMGKHPAFMLKHIDDVKSPISVIRERHAGRQPTFTDFSVSGLDHAGADLRDSTYSVHSNVRDSSVATRHTSAIMGATYAVAIFPYWAEAPDELDVALDEAFIVLSRTAGWWMVQRNNPITGSVSRNPSKQGWVPSGALLETSIPVTTATAEAKTARISIPIPSLTSSVRPSKPILPSCILSASFQSVALRDYQAKGDGEIGLLTNDLVRVYKKYNHWAYIVQENGRRGWVPSWFLSKVPSDSS